MALQAPTICRMALLRPAWPASAARFSMILRRMASALAGAPVPSAPAWARPVMSASVPASRASAPGSTYSSASLAEGVKLLMMALRSAAL